MPVAWTRAVWAERWGEAVTDVPKKTPGQYLDEALRDVKRASKVAAEEVRKVAREACDGGVCADDEDGASASGEGPSDRAADRGEGPRTGWAPGGRAVDGVASAGERQYAVWIHAAAGLAWIVTYLSAGITFIVPVLVALVMWQARKHDSPFIDDHGREATNFQISLFPVGILLALLTCGIGLLAMPVLTIAAGVVALMAANRGEYFRYPMCFRFIPAAS